MLRQIIYVSACLRPDFREEVKPLLDTTHRNNSANGVTGVLAYANRCFLQVLEGPPDTVEQTFERIGRDPRHRVIEVLSDELVETRCFSDWSMAWRDLPADDPLAAKIKSVSKGEEIEHARDALVASILDGFLEDSAKTA